MATKNPENYAQCSFTREGEKGSQMSTTAWIDAKQAKIGKRMTFKGSNNIWTVASAGESGPKPWRTSWGGMD